MCRAWRLQSGWALPPLEDGSATGACPRARSATRRGIAQFEADLARQDSEVPPKRITERTEESFYSAASHTGRWNIHDRASDCIIVALDLDLGVLSQA